MKTAVLVLLAAAAVTAHAADAAQVADTPPFDAKRLAHDVQVLASDAYQGRAVATPGETKTLAYLIDQFRQAGLQPAGDPVAGSPDGKRAWTQDVPLGRFDITGPVTVSVGGGAARTAWTQGSEIAIRAAMNGARRVAIENAPLVFVGYGVTAPERGWDDFKGVDLHGKIAVVLINDPDVDGGEGDFGGKAMTYYGRWTYKYEEMARRGAIGTLIVHETAPAAYGWATVKNSNTNVMYDIARADPAAAHSVLEAWIQRDAALDLFRRAGLDFDAAKKLAQRRAFQPVPLTGVTFSASFAVDARVIHSKNVVAIRPGSERPGQFVMYSAHWDHLGLGPNGAIYNGAIDNGTGLAGLLALARAFGPTHGARQAPQRSVLFLAVTAEEKGLLGSEYYASNPLYRLDQTAGLINMDALSPEGPARNFTISGNARLALLDDLTALAHDRGRAYTPDPQPAAGKFFRSDHFSLAKRGVPAISFGSGNDWVAGGVAAGQGAKDRYTAVAYHQPADKFDPAWSFGGMAQDLALLYDLGRNLADSSRWPNWSADSEFRTMRDASAAQRK